MAEYLASIFGTEKDKVNCSFYFKIGACRHGDRCSRIHNKPTFSQTVLLQNLYHNPQNSAQSADGSHCKFLTNLTEEEVQEHFDNFFEDVFVELEDKYGEIEEMNVCDNLGDHLVGNVYVKFRREEDAEKAVEDLNKRWFAGRPIYAELSPVTDFREACCRQYEMGECTRSGFCNFMHLKPISRELRRELYGRHRRRSFFGFLPISSLMDVNEEIPKNVLAASGTTGSVSVSLHPIVIRNISRQWTKAQEHAALQVIGALIGKQKSHNIQIMNSFELVFDRIEGDIVIDKDYYSTKEQQFKQVFSELDFLGWYTTGDAVNESDIKVHKQIWEMHESPVFLKLNPVGRHTELPVSMYESVIDLVSGEATMLFVELPYTLATEEAERIGLDHMARMSTNESGESSLVTQQQQAGHSCMRGSRVRLILDYVKAVKEGRAPLDDAYFSEAYNLSHFFPVLFGENFQEEYYNDQYSENTRKLLCLVLELEDVQIKLMNKLLTEDNRDTLTKITTQSPEKGKFIIDMILEKAWTDKIRNKINDDVFYSIVKEAHKKTSVVKKNEDEAPPVSTEYCDGSETSPDIRAKVRSIIVNYCEIYKIRTSINLEVLTEEFINSYSVTDADSDETFLKLFTFIKEYIPTP